MIFKTINYVTYVIVLFNLIAAIYYIADRVPPIKVLDYSFDKEEYRLGEYFTVTTNLISHEKEKTCNVKVSAWLIDGGGVRYTLPERFVSKDAIASIRQQYPAQSINNRLIPKSFNPGPAEYHIDLEYTCNPLHNIWPIHVQQVKFFIVSD